MSHRDGFETATQRVHIERPPESESEREVVEPALRFQLRQEPEPLLRKGQRSRPLSTPGRQGGNLSAVSLRANPIHRRGQVGDGRTFEGGPQRKLDLKRTPDAGDHLGGQEGMAPKLEEMVPHPHPLQAEDVRPDAGQQLFRDAPRRHVG